MKDKVLEYNGTDKYWSVLIQTTNNDFYSIFSQIDEEPCIEHRGDINILTIPLPNAKYIKLNDKKDYRLIKEVLTEIQTK